MRRSVYWWILALLAYTTVSLTWLGRHSVEKVQQAPIHTGGVVSPAVPPSGQSSVVHDGSGRADPAVVTFPVAFSVETLERTGEYRFALRASGAASPCTVQVIAECDHHFSYSHVYTDVTPGADDFVFTAPLTGKEAAHYWRPVEHTGPWTEWERSGLRRLEVKVFTKSGTRMNTELHYESVAATVGGECRLDWSHVLTGPVALGERFELAFDLAGWNGNPFDYKALPIVFEVAQPGGGTKRIRPFLHQNFEAVSGLERETIRPRGPKHFLARYRPGVAGRHSYRLLCGDAGGGERVLGAGTFDVTPGTVPDFLRISTRSPRYFEHADGRFFYAVGWDIPYPVDRPYGQEYVPYLPGEKSLSFTLKLLDDLARAGGNFTRLWMSDWWNGLEWNRSVDNFGGIGRYNLKNAWINDQILAHCERRGIHVQLETLTHSSLKDDYGWPMHPYNAKNGGFLADWRTYWTHPKVLSHSDNQLTYIVARYADSPAIQSWNVMSEPDILGRDRWPQAKAHVLSRLRFIRGLDPYGHITCNQLCMSDRDPDFFLEKEVQFVNANAYAGGIAGLADDQIMAIRGFSERYGGHGKPMMVAETAGHYAGDPAFKMRRDTLGALWSGVAGSLAGTPLSWWWNFNYGEDLGGMYRVVADFMKDEDLAAEDAPEKGGWRNRAVACTNRAGNLRVLMAGNATRRFLFAYNYDTLSRTRGIASRCADNSVRFRGMTPGAYVAEYWDLHAGRTAQVQELRVDEDGIGEIRPPDFAEGWAVKIRARNDADDRLPGANSGAVPSSAVTKAVPGETAAHWAWRVLPVVGVAFPAAAERAVVEVRIGLPEACRGWSPRVEDPDGKPVPFSWQRLGDGEGWRILVRGTSAGALIVKASKEALAAESLPDEESWGLQVSVATVGAEPLSTAQRFEQRFAALTDKRQARMSVIDQVENPLGESERFLAVYQGPLLAATDGEYVFASNSDDGSFVKIDGQVVVSRPGARDIDVLNQPAANTWVSRGAVNLRHGLHWVEYYHQQSGGACLARLGWRPPKADTSVGVAIAQPFSDGTAVDAMGVVPEWALDGRIPCTVEVQYKGRTQASFAPCLGVELRRPRTQISVVAMEEGKGTRYLFFRGEGLQWIECAGRKIPAWAWNPARRAFSMEWELCVTGTNAPFLKTFVYDMDMPLTVQVAGLALGEQPHPVRRWVAWPVREQDQGAAFTIGLGPLVLLRGELGRWPGMPDQPAAAPRKSVALERLVEVGLAESGAALDGRHLSRWWSGVPPERIVPERLCMDPWNGEPDAVTMKAGGLAGGTGVLLRLDRRVVLLGLSGVQVYGRAHALLRAIRRAGAEPVLVLNPDVDLDEGQVQDAALAFHRLSLEFACPFVDLREPAP